MAVTNTPIESAFKIVVQTGINAQGNPVYRNRNFNNVKPSATDEDVFAIANSLAGIQLDNLHGIERVNTDDLAES